MAYSARHTSLVLLLALSGGGCPDAKPKASPTVTVCERLDECNYLGAGVNVTDCSSETSECLDQHKASERDDWALQTSDCLRFSSCENFARCLAEVAACSVGSPDNDADGGVEPSDEVMLMDGLIQFSRLYSAYDGVHDYQVTPSVPLSDPGSDAENAIDESSLIWTVDDQYVRVQPFAGLHGAVLLTTKRSGTTTLKVNGSTRRGTKVRGEAQLIIASVEQVEWDAGEARFNNGTENQATAGGGSCGLPVTFELPRNAACGNCHNAMTSTISIEHTPTQTAGYSNDQLIQIFTTGAKPAGGSFNSPFLRAAPMPDCIYKAFHTLDLSDDEEKGIVWKLRSIAPKALPEIDVRRLAPMGRP